MGKKGVYKYRGEVILLQDNDKWIVTGNYYGEYNTLTEAYNTIDKHVGGYSGKCMPQRWLQDEVLKNYFNGEKLW